MPHAVKQGEFCKLRGVSKGRGSQWRKAGLLVFNDEGMVLVDESNALLDSRLDVGKRAAAAVVPTGTRSVELPKQSAPASSQEKTDQERDTFAVFNRARAEKEQELAISARLDREEREGSLVQADAVRTAASQLAMLIGGGLDTLPTRIVSMLEAEPDRNKREAIIEGECRRLREDFAKQATALLAFDPAA